ncbi:MAG: hypothetical protein AB2552_17515 [Candidatus Thiodiazotropha endolucinida]
MKQEILSPFAGEPKTGEYIDESGNTAFRVTPRVLTPERVKLAEFLAGLCSLALMVGGFYGLTKIPSASPWLWFALLLLPALTFPVLNSFWRHLFYTETVMVLTTDKFKVRRWNGWKCFNRTLKHKFALIPHDKTQKEKDANELAVRQGQARGQVVAPKRYYGDSFHLSFQYIDQRNDILTIYGRKEAAAIVTRLTACDERLNQLIGMGDGVSLSPDDQWTPEPGDIL